MLLSDRRKDEIIYKLQLIEASSMQGMRKPLFKIDIVSSSK